MPELHEAFAELQQWRLLCASQGIPRSAHWTTIQEHFEGNVTFRVYMQLVIGATEGCLVG